MTHFDKIQSVLRKKNNLCDDCLSKLAKIKSRQTVNSICNKKANEGLITRKTGKCTKCKKVKIINKLNKVKNRRTQTNEKPPKSKTRFKPILQKPVDQQFNGLINEFGAKVRSGEIEIYNEFSLQHELGIYLRSKFQNHKVQFERNVAYFGFDKSEFSKKEIDISIFCDEGKGLDSIIELKFPQNGQYPEQMYSFCKDIAFAEELKRVGFKRSFVLIFAEDHLFYSGNTEGIYGYFRGEKILTGSIPKPTGKKTSEIHLRGRYQISWQSINARLKYTLIEAQ